MPAPLVPVLSLSLLASVGDLHGGESLAGRWMGQLDLQGETTVIRLVVDASGNTLTATADLLPAGPAGLAVGRLSRDRTAVSFELPVGADTFRFAGEAAGDEMAGSIHRGDATGTFRLIRLASVEPARLGELHGNYETESGRVVWIGPFGEFGADLYVLDFETGNLGALYPRTAAHFVGGPAVVVPFLPTAIEVTFERDAQGAVASLLYRDGNRAPVRARRRNPVRRDVSFRNGPVGLTGTLTLPPSKGPHPAILLLHGSGPEDRHFLGPWIDFFARQGLAVLSWDKRGTGSSGGDWRGAGFDELGGDAEAALGALQAAPEVDRKRVGLFGISQGGWLAPLLAARHPGLAFIVLHAGPSVTPGRQGELFLEHELRGYGLPEEQIADALAYQRLDDELTRSGRGWETLQAAHRKAADAQAPWLIGELKPADDWFRRMYGKMIDFDPVPLWRQVECPVLAFFGELDHNVPPEPNANTLRSALARAGRRPPAIVVLPKANHLFLRAETGLTSEYPRLRGFVPGYFDELARWLQGVLARR
jgi:pimeloyl-ACP methyl ester carboxylesterase